jgi:hypothetical protein
MPKTVCRSEVLSYKSIFHWFKKFREGYEDAEHDQRLGGHHLLKMQKQLQIS